jgi:hypothetical protein
MEVLDAGVVEAHVVGGPACAEWFAVGFELADEVGEVAVVGGGNDLLVGHLPRAILRRLHQIAQRIQPLGARVVVNTVYDPSDGDNEVGRRELGLPRLATIELRRRLNA